MCIVYTFRMEAEGSPGHRRPSGEPSDPGTLRPRWWVALDPALCLVPVAACPHGPGRKVVVDAL